MIDQKQLDLQQTKMLNKLSVLELPGLENLRLDKLLFSVTGFSMQAGCYKSIKYILKRLISNSFYLNETSKESRLLIVTYDYKRKDHIDAWNTVKKLFSIYDEISMGEAEFCKKQLLPFNQIYESLKKWSVYISGLKKIGTFKECSILAASLIELERIRRRIIKLSIEKKVVLIFFDGGSLENLVIQELKLNGSITVTMQHGQPVFHGLNTDRINQTMILNFTSDYVIVTGDYAKKQFMLGGLRDEQIKVLGSLRKIALYHESKRKKFSIFLDCPTYARSYEDNCYMLEIAENIAEKMSMEYIVKLHPQDAGNRYKHLMLKRGLIVEKNSTIEEALNDSEFSILHASGVYLDILSYGNKSFCLKTTLKFPLVENDLDLFENIFDLTIKINKWKEKSTNNKKEYIKELQNYYLKPQNALEQHKIFIESLMKDY